jgi:hypothetical protein
LGILWSKSGSIERDNNDARAGGALAYFYAGGTTTPITVYQDAAETTPHEHPVEAASSGRWPDVFIPFRASYDLKVTTSTGTQLYYPLNIPNADPVEASEDSVEAAELIATGDWKFRTTTGTLTGYVRANGRTIGSASSGASERANDDTEDLYTFLWNGHANGILAVSTGRGGSAAADFAANKTIALPDARSASIMGVDDMGNSALSAGYGGSFTTGNATTGGSVGGANTHTLTTAESAAHTHSFSATTSSDGSHTHTGTTDSGGAHTHTGSVTAHAGTGGASGTGNFTNASDGSRSVTIDSGGAHTHTFTSASGGSHTHTVSGTSGSTGDGGAHNNMPRHVLGTWYIKL